LSLGRTGAGKTALLKQILRKHRDTSTELSPEALALNFVTNSSVIQFFEEAGVHLDIFYTLLWRHIITGAAQTAI
jgi:ABC-type ATPase involved in cell division